MILVYENACKKAGISKKQTATIRNYIDGQKKRVKKRKETMKKLGVSFGPMDEALEKAESGEATLGTSTEDPLERIIHDMDIARLRECLSRLSDDDRRVIMTIYGCDDRKANVKRAAEILGKPRSTVSSAHRRILEVLKKDFFEEN